MSQVRRILAIDGGGIKGVMPAAFLAAIEQTTGNRIVDHFDLIAGTSTGGIIALGLGLGLSASDILRFYEEKGPIVFDQARFSGWLGAAGGWVRGCYRWSRRAVMPKYNPGQLRIQLQSAIGDKKLGESSTRLLVPAFDRERHDIHIFKTAHHERLGSDWRTSAVDVALATAAAPSYFPGHRLQNGISLIDGGVWANNPVGLAVVEAIGLCGWPRDGLRVLSLGCTEELIEVPDRTGIAGLAPGIVSLFMTGQFRAANGTAKILTGHTEKHPRLYRYDQIVPRGTYAMDGTKQIASLAGLGAALARQALPTIQDVFLRRARAPFVPVHPTHASAGTTK